MQVSHSRPQTESGRRGVATVWIILMVPAALALLALVTDVAQLWLARIELENAVEAGALAAADVWGDGDDDSANRTTAHVAAKAFVEANTILGNTIQIPHNDDDSADNNNGSCPAAVLLGTYDVTTRDFDASAVPGSPDERACRVEASATVDSLWNGFGGPHMVRASAVARYDSGSGTAVLVQIAPGDDPCTGP